MCHGFSCTGHPYTTEEQNELFKTFVKDMRKKFTEAVGNWLQERLKKEPIEERDYEEMVDMLYKVEKELRKKFGDAQGDWFCETWEEGL